VSNAGAIITDDGHRTHPWPAAQNHLAYPSIARPPPWPAVRA